MRYVLGIKKAPATHFFSGPKTKINWSLLIGNGEKTWEETWPHQSLVSVYVTDLVVKPPVSHGLKFTMAAHLDVSSLVVPDTYILTRVVSHGPHKRILVSAFYNGKYRDVLMSKASFDEWHQKNKDRVIVNDLRRHT